jgi:hypothetical protein
MMDHGSNTKSTQTAFKDKSGQNGKSKRESGDLKGFAVEGAVLGM